MEETNDAAEKPNFNPPAKPWYVKEYAAEKPEVTVNQKAVINRQGKDFVLYWGLLDAAHRAGMTSISTTLVQAPTSLNGGIAICHATVEFPWGSYTGIGDADDGNVGKMIVPHKIRMAETRAKARAIRDAINVNMVSVEEMTELPQSGATPAFTSPSTPSPASGSAPRPVAPPDRTRIPAPVAARPVPTGPQAGADDLSMALAKFNRIRATAIKMRDAHRLTFEDAMIAPFTEDATAADVEAASQRLIARINTAVQPTRNGNGAGK